MFKDTPCTLLSDAAASVTRFSDTNKLKKKKKNLDWDFIEEKAELKQALGTLTLC